MYSLIRCEWLVAVTVKSVVSLGGDQLVTLMVATGWYFMTDWQVVCTEKSLRESFGCWQATWKTRAHLQKLESYSPSSSETLNRVMLTGR